MRFFAYVVILPLAQQLLDADAFVDAFDADLMRTVRIRSGQENQILDAARLWSDVSVQIRQFLCQTIHNSIHTIHTIISFPLLRHNCHLQRSHRARIAIVKLVQRMHFGHLGGVLRIVRPNQRDHRFADQTAEPLLVAGQQMLIVEPGAEDVVRPVRDATADRGDVTCVAERARKDRRS